MTNALDEAISAIKKRHEEERGDWLRHKSLPPDQIVRAASDFVLPGLSVAGKAYVGHAVAGHAFLGADPGRTKPHSRKIHIAGKLFRPITRKSEKTASGTNRERHVFPDFPPKFVNAIEDETLLHGLAEHVLKEASPEEIRLLIAALRAVMRYDLTENALWEEAAAAQPSARLYMCDPEPESFAIEADGFVSGRVNALVDFETEIMPGYERRVTAIIPTRFYLFADKNGPRVVAVTLHASV
jgi:hypothetical protein